MTGFERNFLIIVGFISAFIAIAAAFVGAFAGSYIALSTQKQSQCNQEQPQAPLLKLKNPFTQQVSQKGKGRQEQDPPLPSTIRHWFKGKKEGEKA